MNESHWAYIAIAYGVTIAVIGILALRIVLEYRRLRSALARFDQKGVTEGDRS